ncbi:MAG: EamA family transporter [Alphaproteobacteria bacterium]|nr:EamA family transporter [Alphaproteobacteria bacterium]|tara:strand:+ start:1460 stop:2335 length:876 start_codon:yes stop_codon:yes gene_type:complete
MTVAPSNELTPRARLDAIATMCFASLCFIAMHGFIKTVRGDVPIALIIWSQYLFQAILLTTLLGPRLSRVVTTQLFGLQIVRALTLMATVSLMFVAVGLMPLAEAIAIGFVAPLIIAGASALFLKERVTAKHWAAILVGFGGVLIVIRPGTSVFDTASLVPLAAAICAATYQTLTRPISQAVSSTSLLYTATLVGLAASSMALPFFWVTPSLIAIAYLAAAACLGAAAHFLLIRAYQAAPASLVAPFSYSELIWASAIGLAVFGDVPDAMTIIGGMILAASGLYILRRPST